MRNNAITFELSSPKNELNLKRLYTSRKDGRYKFQLRKGYLSRSPHETQLTSNKTQ